MSERVLTSEVIESFRNYLLLKEKSRTTLEKYTRDIKAFKVFIKERNITKELVISYKQKLISDGYAARSINSMISALNCFFDYLQWYDLRVKNLKIQQEVFCPEEKELTRDEYFRLLNTAQKNGNERLNLILQTICGTGIRVSELEYITVESAKKGKAVINCKGKTRVILIVRALQKKIIRYAVRKGIKSGSVFITREGKPVSRSNIWREMKNLCEDAEVNPSKVFPHNLRHLFARLFYAIEKDIAQLADILGHSNINTTRIYIKSTGEEHLKKLEKMELIQ